MKGKKRKLYTEDYMLGDEEKPAESAGKSTRNLKSVEEKIPQEYRHVFSSSFSHFNHLQSEVFDDVFHNDNSFVLSAPTSSGKTVIFEIGILRLLMEAKKRNLEKNFKIIYISPIKALINEKYRVWSEKFQSLLQCIEVTGDHEVQSLEEISDYQLILSTPEKWDSLTRRWRDNKEIVESIKLFLVDEVHLLNEDRRGSTLEAIVSRMKLIVKNKEDSRSLRFICVSATIPNIEDLKEWLKTKENPEVKFYSMNESFRPVQLEKHVLGYFSPKNFNTFRFDINLNYKLAAVIKQYSENKPTLIFCSSRKSIELAAGVLETSLNCELTGLDRHRLQQVSSKIQDTKLKSSLAKGIAYHHGGMSLDDRVLIENTFRDGIIPVLLSTTTLSMGVNLPAHLVIIKSTQIFKKGKCEEYDESTILQMIGRCGRPQFDTKGIAVIMTQDENVTRYKNLVTGNTPVESHLHKHLTEHINSEIVLQTISNLSIAVDWVQSTFLYVRAYKNPGHYGMPLQQPKEKIDKKLEEMCVVAINALERNGLVYKDQQDGFSVTSTEFGRIMSRYYLAFETMKTFNQIRGTESLMEMLNLLSQCHEFKDFTFRTNDKKHLNQLNQNLGNGLRYPIKGRIKSLNMKISCLIQATLGNLTVTDYSLQTECQKIMQAGKRIGKCCVEWILASDKKSLHGNYRALVSAITLAKCMEASLWENSKFITKQVEKIGMTFSGMLGNGGFNTWDKILKANPRDIERVAGKMPPFGNDLIEFAEKLPKYELELSMAEEPDTIQITVVQLNPHWQFEEKDDAYLIVGDAKNHLLLYCDDLNLQLSSGIEKYSKSINVSQSSQSIHANLIHSKIVGLDITKQLDLNAPIKLSSLKSKNVKLQENSKMKKTQNLNSTITDYFEVIKEKPQLALPEDPVNTTDLDIAAYVQEIRKKINKVELEMSRDVILEASVIVDDERCPSPSQKQILEILKIQEVEDVEMKEETPVKKSPIERKDELIQEAKSPVIQRQDSLLNRKFSALFSVKKRLSSFELPQKPKMLKMEEKSISEIVETHEATVSSTQDLFEDEDIKDMEDSVVTYSTQPKNPIIKDSDDLQVDQDNSRPQELSSFQEFSRIHEKSPDHFERSQKFPGNLEMSQKFPEILRKSPANINIFQDQRNNENILLTTQQIFNEGSEEIHQEIPWDVTEVKSPGKLGNPVKTPRKLKNPKKTPGRQENPKNPTKPEKVELKEDECISQLKEKCIVRENFSHLSLEAAIKQWEMMKPVYFQSVVMPSCVEKNPGFRLKFNRVEEFADVFGVKIEDSGEKMEEEEQVDTEEFYTPENRRFSFDNPGKTEIIEVSSDSEEIVMENPGKCLEKSEKSSRETSEKSLENLRTPGKFSENSVNTTETFLEAISSGKTWETAGKFSLKTSENFEQNINENPGKTPRKSLELSEKNEKSLEKPDKNSKICKENEKLPEATNCEENSGASPENVETDPPKISLEIVTKISRTPSIPESPKEKSNTKNLEDNFKTPLPVSHKNFQLQDFSVRKFLPKSNNSPFKTPAITGNRKENEQIELSKDPRYRDLFSAESKNKKYFQTPRNVEMSPVISTNFYQIVHQPKFVENSMEVDELEELDSQNPLAKIFQQNYKKTSEQNQQQTPRTSKNFICMTLKIHEHPKKTTIDQEPEESSAIPRKKPRKTHTLEEFCDKSILDMLKQKPEDPTPESPGKRSRNRGIFPYTPSLSEVAGRFRKNQACSMETFEKIVEDIVSQKDGDLEPSFLEEQRNFVRDLHFNDRDIYEGSKGPQIVGSAAGKGKMSLESSRSNKSSARPEINGVIDLTLDRQEVTIKNPPKLQENNVSVIQSPEHLEKSRIPQKNDGNFVSSMLNPPKNPVPNPKRLGIPMRRMSVYSNQKPEDSSQESRILEPPKQPVNYGRTMQEYQMFNEEFNSSRSKKTTKIGTSLRKEIPKLDESQPVKVTKYSKFTKDDEDNEERQKQIEICKKKLDEKNYDVDSYLNDFLRLQFSDNFY